MSDDSTYKAIAALSAFQGEVGIVPKTKTANVVKDGRKLYEFKYADIADVLAHALPLAAKHGLALLQSTEIVNGRIFVHTEVAHKEGGIIKGGSLPAGSADAPMQTIGGNLTYTRRYGACIALGLASEEDLDMEMTDNRPPPREGPRASETRTLPPARSQAQVQARRRQAPPEDEPVENVKVVLTPEQEAAEDEFRMELDLIETSEGIAAAWERWKTGRFKQVEMSNDALHAVYDYVKLANQRVKRQAGGL